jgi:hypothetical protein
VFLPCLNCCLNKWFVSATAGKKAGKPESMFIAEVLLGSACHYTMDKSIGRTSNATVSAFQLDQAKSAKE